MHFKLLKKNYSDTESLQFLNPTNGVMLDTYSSNKQGLVILTPTNSELSKQEFIEYIDDNKKNLQNIKLEVSKEYDKLRQIKAKVYNKA